MREPTAWLPLETGSMHLPCPRREEGHGWQCTVVLRFTKEDLPEGMATLRFPGITDQGRKPDEGLLAGNIFRIEHHLRSHAQDTLHEAYVEQRTRIERLEHERSQAESTVWSGLQMVGQSSR